MLNNDLSHTVGQAACEKGDNKCAHDNNKTSGDTNEVAGVNGVKPLNNTNESCGVTSTNTNHLHECTGRGDYQTNLLEHEAIPIYNVNAEADDKVLASLLSKSVSKKILINDHGHCDTFKNWKLQMEFEIGFIPLTNLVLPHSKYIGPGFESPIDQHYTVKSYGVPNFLGARSP